MDEHIKHVLDTRSHYIEMMAAGLIARIGPEAVTDYTLVEQTSDDGLTRRWWFEHKSITGRREPAPVAAEAAN